jgi:phage/plasmid primase-like uncharacterized protein
MHQTFEDVLIDFGMVGVTVVPDDGHFHRYAMSGKGVRDKSGWAIKFADGAGLYNCWSHANGDEGIYWHPSGKEYKELSENDRRLADSRREELKIKRKELNQKVAERSLSIWNECVEVNKNPYLSAKKVGAFGVRTNSKGELIVPVRDFNGKIWSLQRIFPSAEEGKFEKSYSFGGVLSYNMHRIDGSDDIILCEGYATGASIHMATGCTVIVCFDAGNMKKVAEHFKNTPKVRVAADRDKEEKGAKGQKVAQEIKDTFGIPYVIPEVYGDFNDLACAGVDIGAYFFETLEAYSFQDYLNDTSPIPDDLIEPRILIKGGMAVIAGEPKVGKSEFIMLWFAHMAAGIPFMGMRSNKPLRVFYLQTEVTYHMMRERIQFLNMPKEHKDKIKDNLIITPRVNMLLDDGGVERVGNTMRKFGDFDIIAVDPISNVFDGDNESHNSEMLSFLQLRIEALRNYTSAKKETGIVLVHHTKKVSLEELIEAPFQCFRGASSLRGYYNTGMIMYKESADPADNKRVIAIERRDSKPDDGYMPNLVLEKVRGQWFQLPTEQKRVSQQIQGSKNDAERDRKINVIIDSIEEQHSKGIKHTKSTLAKFLDGKNGLGSVRTIETLIDVMIAQEILCFDNIENSKKNFLKIPS